MKENYSYKSYIQDSRMFDSNFKPKKFSDWSLKFSSFFLSPCFLRVASKREMFRHKSSIGLSLSKVYLHFSSQRAQSRDA